MKLQYDSLLEATSEIRLITLPPGITKDSENIRFRLWHTPLHEPVEVCNTRLSVKDVNETLPPGWSVVETHQYDYRYLFEEDETENTTWSHPDPACDGKHWAPKIQSPPTDYKPEYEALSYTWGSAENPEIALVEYHGTSGHCQAKTGTLPIGQNLAKALRHLRCPDASRTLWVDAVCINQEDLLERECQVKRMATLYRLARRVVVWLGPASHDSDTAMSSLNYLGSQLEISRNRYRFRAPAAVEPEWFRAICPLPFPEKVWVAIESLFERPWFERLWIWQEIQLANSYAIVVCGKSELLWQDLRKAIVALYTKHELPTAHLRRRLDIVEPLTNETYGCSFGMVANMSRERGCMDPRDKIYGMLSICSPRFAEKIEISYTKEVAEVYKDVFLRYSLQTQRLDLLPSCEQSLQRPDCPSWVPNWALKRETYNLGGFCWASGISKSELRYIPSGRLQVTGLESYVIQTVTPAAPLHPSETLGIVRKWEPHDLLTRTHVNGEPFVDVYCTTLRAGYLSERWPSIGAPSLEEWKTQYLDHVSSLHTENLSQEFALDADIEWMLKIVRGRVLMTTEEGHIGLGPGGARSGDKICVLLGCKQPMVLRPHAEADAFVVIGECYVHALENSVAILGPLPPHVRPQLQKIAQGYGARQTFLNLETGLTSSEDPRLEQLGAHEDWESVPHDWNADDPVLCAYYKHKRSGEVMNSDPRLLPSTLQKKGVPLRLFDLC